jgi:hypothetical protein
MALRCGCMNEADDIVFGLPHECTVNPRPPADLPRFIPSWRFVVPAQYDGDPNGWQELRPYEETLGPDELED